MRQCVSCSASYARLLAALLALSGCASSGAAGRLYVENGDSALAGGRWGEAMAAYDAAHNEAPSDPMIIEHRRDAAARWIELTAPEVAKATPAEKALVLLNALAEEGRKRGADAAVNQYVAPLLDAAVSRAWGADETSEDPKVLWRTVSRGEQLTRALPDDSPSRVKLVALRRRASALFADRSRKSSNPSATYLYESIAARMNGVRPDSAVVDAIDAVTAFDYHLTIEPMARCPQLEPMLKKRIDFFKNFAPRDSGLRADLSVSVDCAPLAPPRQRRETRSWVESHIEYSSSKSCVDRTNMVAGGSYSVSHSSGMGGARYTTYTDVSPTYQTVPDCTTTRTSQTVTENKTDIVTMTTEERGYNARGGAILGVGGKAYRMPISARMVYEKITTEGRIFGTREGGDIPIMDYLELTAHSLWLELTFLAAHAQESYAADLLERAESEEGDARLGDMVSAVRVHHRVTPKYAKWFGDTLGLDEQDLGELVLGAAHIATSLKVAGDYKLDVPKVDANLARIAAEKKRASGEDDFK